MRDFSVSLGLFNHMQGMRTMTPSQQPPPQDESSSSKENLPVGSSTLNYSVSNASTASNASTFSQTSTSSVVTTDSDNTTTAACTAVAQLGNSTSSDFGGSLTNASSTDTGIDLNETRQSRSPQSTFELPDGPRISVAERKANLTFLLKKDSTASCSSSSSTPSSKPTTTSSSSPKTHLPSSPKALGALPSLRNSPFVQKDAKRIKLQKVAAELLQTEQSYSAALDLLDVHLRERLQPPLLTADQLHQLLGPFTPLRQLSAHFIEQFGACLANWERKPKIAHVLVKFGPFLKQYGDFGSKFDSINTMFADLYKKNSAFQAAITKFESEPRCNSLSIRHYLLRPIQRLPQYKLLLEKFCKCLADDTQHPDYEDSAKALAIVTEAAEHTNERLRLDENWAKLMSIQQCLRGSYELLRPHRKLLKKGMLQKISRKGTQDRLFLLCSDCLIYLSVVGDQSYRMHHELPLTGMRVEQPQHEFITEIHVHSKVRSIRVLAASAELRDEWTQAIRDAIQANRKRRTSMSGSVRKTGLAGFASRNSVLSRMNSQRLSNAGIDLGLNVVNDEPDLNDSTMVDPNGTLAPPPLGSEAPIWVPDGRVTMCQLCTCEFSLTVRRHHCRACGQVVCAKCSTGRVELAYMRRKQRVCDACYEKLGPNKSIAVDSSATSLETLKDSANKSSSFRLKVNTDAFESRLENCSNYNSLDSVNDLLTVNGIGGGGGRRRGRLRTESFSYTTASVSTGDLVEEDVQEMIEEGHEMGQQQQLLTVEPRRRSVGAIRQSYLMAQRRSSGSSVFFTGWSVQKDPTEQQEQEGTSQVSPTPPPPPPPSSLPNGHKNCVTSVQRSQSHTTADQLSSHLNRISVRASGRRRVPKRLCEVSANDPNSNMAGYMWRRLSKRHWKRYWFVLKDKVLYSYRESEDVMALQTLPLLGYRLERVDTPLDGHPAELCFAITHQNQPSIYFRLEHATFIDKWFEVLEAATHL